MLQLGFISYAGRKGLKAISSSYHAFRPSKKGCVFNGLRAMAALPMRLLPGHLPPLVALVQPLEEPLITPSFSGGSAAQTNTLPQCGQCAVAMIDRAPFPSTSRSSIVRIHFHTPVLLQQAGLRQLGQQ